MLEVGVSPNGIIWKITVGAAHFCPARRLVGWLVTGLQTLLQAVLSPHAGISPSRTWDPGSHLLSIHFWEDSRGWPHLTTVLSDPLWSGTPGIKYPTRSPLISTSKHCPFILGWVCGPRRDGGWGWEG